MAKPPTKEEKQAKLTADRKALIEEIAAQTSRDKAQALFSKGIRLGLLKMGDVGKIKLPKRQQVLNLPVFPQGEVLYAVKVTPNGVVTDEGVFQLQKMRHEDGKEITPVAWACAEFKVDGPGMATREIEGKTFSVYSDSDSRNVLAWCQGIEFMRNLFLKNLK